MKMTNILITGAAGFIGSNLASSLLALSDFNVIGIDNLNSYYDPELKIRRLKNIFLKHSGESDLPESMENLSFKRFKFYRINLEERNELEGIFEQHQFDIVVNLAAQAGVRHSIDNPDAYINSNIIGFYNILELCRSFHINKLVYASSSSVYGDINSYKGFKESQNVDRPISLYAATKKSNELMAHTYAHLFKIQTIGLRFFTVYGPWGRPDMAYYSFTKKIIDGDRIDLFNFGNQFRDFTYIDDVIEGIVNVLRRMDSIEDNYNIFNLGNSHPETLLNFVRTLENHIGKRAVVNLIEKQPGDVVETYADTDKLFDTIGFRPSTSLDKGLKAFVDWYLMYYKISEESLKCAE